MVYDIHTITRGLEISRQELIEFLSLKSTLTISDEDLLFVTRNYELEYMKKIPFRFYKYKSYTEDIYILGNQKTYIDTFDYQQGKGLLQSYNEYFKERNIDNITDTDIQEFLYYNNSSAKKTLEFQKKYTEWSMNDNDMLLYAKKSGFFNTEIKCYEF